MSDETDISTESDQPTTQPAANAATASESDLVSQFEKLLDKRFSGFQGLLDQRTAALAQELDQLKTANLSPEEQEQLQTSKEQDKISALERENALLKLRKQYPEEVDFMEQFFGAQSLEDQLSMMASFRKAKAEETPSEESPQSTPVVDANNPRRQLQPSLAVGGQMNEQMADQILAASQEPGLLTRIRRSIGG